MKIKILKPIPRSESKMLVDLKPGEIVAVDQSVAEDLESKGKAEILIE